MVPTKLNKYLTQTVDRQYLYNLHMSVIRRLRTLNPEWLRNPFSRLEETLRLPYLIRYVLQVFTGRLILLWILSSILFWKIFGVLVALLLGFVLALIIELFALRKWYEKSILPKHLLNLEKVMKVYKRRNSFSNKELAGKIEETVKLSSWGLIRIGYVGLASWGWEIVFRWLYPLLVGNRETPYHDLLIGFMNKSMEADQQLWLVAQENDSKKRRQKLDKYLEAYGSRVEDVDLSRPTFREQPEAIKSLLKLYSQTPTPELSFKKAVEKREKSIQIVLQNLRIPKNIFVQFLKLVQKNVALREDRRYYEFLADFYIRRMIILLGKRLNLKESEIFIKPWKELKNEATT